MIVLDASALLAYLFGEPGAEVVVGLLDEAVLSAVNEVEVLTRIRRDSPEPESVELPVHEIVTFDSTQAKLAAAMAPATRPFGLSLADRACLALGLHRSWAVYTADRAWAALDLGVEVRLIRA